MSLADKAATANGNNATILENVDKVFDAGYVKGEETGRTLGYNYGWNDGLQQGMADGKKSEYDRFWDYYQNNGKRRFYGYAFAGDGWNADTFYPKYDIVVSGYSPDSMFHFFGYTRSAPFDLESRMQELGITMDFSAYTSSINRLFEHANISVVPALDFSKLKQISYLCQNSKIVTFRKIKVSETLKYRDNFTSCTQLENITFEGTIGQTGLNFNWSPLSVDSMKSIISCLKDLTGTDGEGVYTIQFSSACWDALEADSTYPDGRTWREYVTDLGWVV